LLVVRHEEADLTDGHEEGVIAMFRLASALLLTLAPAAALAQTTAPLRVSYADLDLRSEAGLKVLDRRLAAAAQTACGEQFGTVDLGRQSLIRHCVATMLDDAAAQRERAIAARRQSPIVTAAR
jgi:UrcA family protein